MFRIQWLIAGMVGLWCQVALALEPVTLQLKWHHQYQFAGYYVAKELGYYQEAGLNVAINPVTPQRHPVNEVLEGKAQYGVGSNDLLLRRAEGKPVVVLGVIFQHSPYVLIAMRDRGVESVHDLIGKHVLIDPFATEIIAYLRKMGMPLDRIHLAEANGYDWRDLVAGRADAYAGYSTNDPYYLDLAKVQYVSFTPRSENIDFYGDNLYTTESEIKEHPARVRKFLDASLRGWRYAVAHPEETADLMIAKGYFPATDREKLLFEARKIKQLISPELVDIGYMHEGRWRHIADTYAEQGMLPAGMSLEGFLYGREPDLLPGWTRWLIAVLLAGAIAAIGMAFFVLRQNRTLFSHFFQYRNRFEKIVSRVPGVVHQLRRRPDGTYCFPFASDAFSRVFGVELAQAHEDASAVFRMMQPEDLDRLLGLMQQSASRGTPLQCECRLVDADNGVRWIFWNALPESDGDGSCTWHGVISDITENKRSEGEMQVASLIFQATSEAMMVTDEAGIVIAINPAFSEITGYSAEEIVGHSMSMLDAGKHEPFFSEVMEKALASSGRWQGETWQRRKNGEVYAQWLSLNTIFSEEGRVQRRVVLFSDLSEKKSREELIWRQANFDTLTELPNRRMVQDRLEQDIRMAERKSSVLAILFIDLDRFKEINDTFGHGVGDAVLRETAGRMKACVRESDTVGRLVGDEFILILKTGADERSAGLVATHLLDCLSQPFEVGGEKIHLSASIGITLYPNDGRNADLLLRNADQAMAAAKQEGRNRFFYFTPALQDAAQLHMQLVNQLHAAIRDQQFAVHYQPIVELATGQVKKAEALLRWEHPVLGTISPAEFIPVAEETRLIVELGDWVFKQAALQVRRLRQSVNPEFQISVNKSPLQLGVTGDSTARWADYLQEVGVPQQSIVVEITENVLMQANDDVHARLSALRQLGVQVALDDFGTGYSSLAYLQKFYIDYVKLDPSFVQNLKSENSDQVLCEAIIDMAHKLGLSVIAEGIETEEQLNVLKAAGCDFGQGHFFARALPQEEFEHYCLALVA